MSTINGVPDAKGMQTFTGMIEGKSLELNGTFEDTEDDTCTGNISVKANLTGPIPPRMIIPMPEVNFDGTADLMWRNTISGATATWLMDTSALRKSATFPGAVSAEWVIKGVGDINGDGPADLAWRNMTSGETAVWLMNDDGLREGATFPGGVGDDWVIRGVDDIDGSEKAMGYGAIWTLGRPRCG